MHRPLPDRPNLEYLKREAKDLLRTLQQQRPVVKLADAQHALARQYGFSSWTRLKRHVEVPPSTARLPQARLPAPGRQTSRSRSRTRRISCGV